MMRQRFMRLGALGVCLALLLGISTTQASANLPNCANCVEAGDIASNGVKADEISASAVGASEIATGAVRSAEILAGAVRGGEIANGSITPDDLSFDPATQAEADALAGYCELAAASPRTYSMAPCGDIVLTVDATVQVIPWVDVAIGIDGLPVAVYNESTNNDVRVVHCGNPSCTSGNEITAIETDGRSEDVAIEIGSDGLPLVAYIDNTNGNLMVGHCGNVACTAGNSVAVVAAADYVGYSASIAIGDDGMPVISYYDATGQDLEFVHCGGVRCLSGNTYRTIDSTGNVGVYGTSIAIGSDSFPVISYWDSLGAGLKVAHCNDATCASSSVVVVDDGGYTGSSSRLVIGTDGYPIITYFEGTGTGLWVAHCGNVSCSSGNTTTNIDPAGSGASIAIGADGLPVISYSKATYSYGDLAIVRCGNLSCSSGNATTYPDTTHTVDGGHPGATVLGADGALFVIYRHVSGRLRAAHSVNV